MIVKNGSPYLRDDLPTSPQKTLLARAFSHWCAIHSGHSPEEIALALTGAASVEPSTKIQVKQAARLIGELAAAGQLTTFVRPVGGGMPSPLPPVYWEIDDVTPRFAASALNFDQPYQLEAEPTHWIFFALDEFNSLIDQSIGEVPTGNRKSCHAESPVPTARKPESAAGPVDRFLRLPEVRRLTGMSRSTIYRRIAEERFPRQISMDGNIAVWREHDVARWLANPE